ncbi:hypothetical protein NEIMUCOT_05674 [Neisseria mucosa ATCC 25996]|uniref:Uncharacterized protein n=1 Tax=Neisseria mucosa (strain ATCC 25996 / DSM 4631 / NCTC 10774 / M26) TaxID=546266 RepID=D2ZYG5_NEIM2|nr:hypothetical protein NEIMUCOT_05674 [Neisseria mucosa ATCC 25996]
MPKQRSSENPNDVFRRPLSYRGFTVMEGYRVRLLSMPVLISP